MRGVLEGAKLEFGCGEIIHDSAHLNIVELSVYHDDVWFFGITSSLIG